MLVVIIHFWVIPQMHFIHCKKNKKKIETVLF